MRSTAKIESARRYCICVRIPRSSLFQYPTSIMLYSLRHVSLLHQSHPSSPASEKALLQRRWLTRRHPLWLRRRRSIWRFPPTECSRIKEIVISTYKRRMWRVYLYLCFDPEEVHDSKNDTEKDVVELLWIGISQAHVISIDDRRRIP